MRPLGIWPLSLFLVTSPQNNNHSVILYLQVLWDIHILFYASICIYHSFLLGFSFQLDCLAYFDLTYELQLKHGLLCEAFLDLPPSLGFSLLVT